VPRGRPGRRLMADIENGAIRASGIEFPAAGQSDSLEWKASDFPVKV